MARCAGIWASPSSDAAHAGALLGARPQPDAHSGLYQLTGAGVRQVFEPRASLVIGSDGGDVAAELTDVAFDRTRSEQLGDLLVLDGASRRLLEFGLEQMARALGNGAARELASTCGKRRAGSSAGLLLWSRALRSREQQFWKLGRNIPVSPATLRGKAGHLRGRSRHFADPRH